jgi:Rrf2 family protein
MKLITRDTDYAIRALNYIVCNEGRTVSITEMVRELETPKPFLRKILQLLGINGILKSYKGKNGGFVLAREPDKIFLLDLMKIFQGQFKISECIFKKNTCPNQKYCLLRAELDSIEKMVLEKISAITLKSLTKNQ